MHSTEHEHMKILISGGGTGGHIFPAIAIANAIKSRVPNAEFLFVGALGRMEMEKVPQAGYTIIGLPVAGFQRGFSFEAIRKNVLFPFKLISSLLESLKIVKSFQPDIAIGVGGYASGPMLWAAQSKGIPTLIQEQNSFAGITNKILARKAKVICTAYSGMERFFPSEKIVLTGNPIRKDIQEAALLKLAAQVHFKLSAEKKTILVIGGSLGARTINQSIAAGVDAIRTADVQLIWQTGKTFYPTAAELCSQKGNGWGEAKAFDFIKEMNLAYAAADLVISRAGALSISELCVVGRAAILVPSPNVSEDHQTQNALALVQKNAAVLVRDQDAAQTLVPTALELIKNQEKRTALQQSIAPLGIANADERIADEVFKLLKSNKESI